MENENEKRSFADAQDDKLGKDPSLTLRMTESAEGDKGAAIPEFISTERLIKAAALLKWKDEKETLEAFRKALAENQGEVFAGLVDFLADVFQV